MPSFEARIRIVTRRYHGNGGKPTSFLICSAILCAACLAAGLIVNLIASRRFPTVSCLCGIGFGPAPALLIIVPLHAPIRSLMYTDLCDAILTPERLITKKWHDYCWACFLEAYGSRACSSMMYNSRNSFKQPIVRNISKNEDIGRYGDAAKTSPSC